jgi:galactokinase
MRRLSELLDPRTGARYLLNAGMSPSEAEAKGKLFSKAAGKLVSGGRGADELAVAVFVPGRIEVLGKHTDYCGGRSLICTVEKGLCLVAVSRSDSMIQYHALDAGESADFLLDAELQPASGHWSNYPMTIARRIARNFPGAGVGAEIALAGDLPAASGLSSSSAMMIGTFLVISALNKLGERPEYQANIHSSEELAGYLGCCENGQTFKDLAGDRGVGTFGGSQDHTAILCCGAGKLSVYSFCPVEREQEIELPGDWVFVVASSGVVAEKTGAARQRYNAVSLRARRLVELWNQEQAGASGCLNDVLCSAENAPAVLGEILSRVAALDAEMRLSARLEQFITESYELIPAAVAAIQKHDALSLGRIVDRSQFNAQTLLENQVPATIVLQEKLRLAGAFAASAFGAGFGGSVWGLVEKKALDRVSGTLAGLGIMFFVTPAACAVTWMG